MTLRRTAFALPLAGLLVVALLVSLPAVASAAFGDRRLAEGMEGDDVRVLQRKLTRLGIETDADGVFGSATKRSVKRFERRNDRRVNGVCSRADARHIKRLVRERRSGQAGSGLLDPVLDDDGSDVPGTHRYGARKLKPGDSGSDVRQLQRYLTQIGLPTSPDGHYGGSTRRNVDRWEAWSYRRANGRLTRREARAVKDDARTGRRYVDRDNAFPVRGPHNYGGSGSRFGAPRNGHTHQGQDVAAAAGTDLAAVHDGRVAFRQYQASGAGHYLVIHGADGSDSVYMHLPEPAYVRPGERVRAGEVIGEVGCTGSCTGPHLHFELWTPHWYDGGAAYDPLPSLKRWDPDY